MTAREGKTSILQSMCVNVYIQSTLVISTSGYLEQPLISKRKSGPCLKIKNLTSGNKILWIREEIAPQEQFLPFPTMFSIYF